MIKTGQIRRCQGVEKVRRHIVATRNHPQRFIKSIAFKKQLFNFGMITGHVKKHKLFITVFTTIHWVDPALLAEPM